MNIDLGSLSVSTNSQTVSCLKLMALFPVYFLFMTTFGLASLDKFKGRQVPDWFLNQFKNTFLNQGEAVLRLMFWSIAVLELIVFFVFAMSLGRMEFLTGNLEYLKMGVTLAMSTFAFLGFGLRVAGDFQGAANLFTYFGSSTAVLVLLSILK